MTYNEPLSPSLFMGEGRWGGGKLSISTESGESPNIPAARRLLRFISTEFDTPPYACQWSISKKSKTMEYIKG